MKIYLSFIAEALVAVLVISAFTGPVSAAPLGDCSMEPQLDGNGNVVFCEPWASQSWYERDGWSSSHTRTYKQLTAESVSKNGAALTSAGCLAGNCLQLQLNKGGSSWFDASFQITHALGLPRSEGLEDVYFRYYLKLGSNFDPRICEEETWTEKADGGKFAGLSDTQGSKDPAGQCGNGGNAADGLNCWSMRGKYGKCGTPFGVDECPANDRAVARIGAYLYFPYQSSGSGYVGYYDNVAMSNSGPPVSSDSSCWKGDPSDTYPPGAKADRCYCNSEANMYCGVGTVGKPQPGNLEPGVWYAIEQRVKMNTPGEHDGIIQAWVNGALAYEKRNVLFRYQGHDNLHVRTAWLNFFLGGAAGTNRGSCVDQNMWVDQMVISTAPIGPMDLVRPDAPAEFVAQ